MPNNYKDSPTTFYAYGEMHAGIEAVMRLHSVKRWHMIDTTRTQTMAEHSANVAVLAGYIAATAPDIYFGPSSHLMSAGILHDIGEVFIGDIPTPTKKEVGGIDIMVKILEESVIPEPLNPKNHGGQAAWELIKICDLADGIRFIRLHGVDATAVHARSGLEKQLKSKWQEAYAKWPLPVCDHVHDLINFYAYR